MKATRAALAAVGLVVAVAAAQADPTMGSGKRDLNECLMLESEKVQDCAKRFSVLACLPRDKFEFNSLACMRANPAGDRPEDHVAQMTRCSEREHAERTKFGEAQKAGAEACRADIEARVAARLDAERDCTSLGNASACVALPDLKLRQKCLSACLDAREKQAHAAVENEQAACELRFIEAKGRGKFACTLPDAAGAPVDASQVEAQVKAALQSKDGAALDEAMRTSAVQLAQVLQAACTKRCNERAPHVATAEKQAPGLVTGYKRCMVAADSTREARKLDAYEADLYCDYIRKADAKCRAASRCDWLEDYSVLECTYLSPGVEHCQ
jgi:hypothetical protein